MGLCAGGLRVQKRAADDAAEGRSSCACGEVCGGGPEHSARISTGVGGAGEGFGVSNSAAHYARGIRGTLAAQVCTNCPTV